jgi:hypothetical protein
MTNFNKAMTTLKKNPALGLWHIVTLIVLLAGAVGSLTFMFNAGRNQSSTLLITLFSIWVVSPFITLMVANGISRGWPDRPRVLLYTFALILTFVSLLMYSGAWSPSGTKAAFMFLVVPFVSWLVIGGVFVITRRRSNQ